MQIHKTFQLKFFIAQSQKHSFLGLCSIVYQWELVDFKMSLKTNLYFIVSYI